MEQKILDEVAYLFVEQFDDLYGMLAERTDVKRIREAADDGLDAIYTVASSVFGEKMDDVLFGAANSEMDYIAYVDETWVPENDEDREKTLDMERLHFESLKALLQMAEQNRNCQIGRIKSALALAQERLIHLERK